ncbi:hypothetical protein K456DRAFT_51664 [Colletotrichum gloeosporioides 23]|nr:hypothetical protein K456DRAFT_51664 [Colletotrichum gloeosporioides 23]
MLDMSYPSYPTSRRTIQDLYIQSTCDYHHRYFQLTFTANYLLSLRLINLASEDLIYYSLRPTTYDHDPTDPTVG